MSKSKLIITGLTVCLILASISLILNTASADNQGTALQPSSPQTTAPAAISQKSASVAGSVTSDIATKYWLELKAYPSSNTRALWLYAGNDWRYLSNPSSNIENSVQQAFSNPNTFEVKVWYSGSKIVGLTVYTK
jgi:hypothetical protein